jgi:hypothetical protein
VGSLVRLKTPAKASIFYLHLSIQDTIEKGIETMPRKMNELETAALTWI